MKLRIISILLLMLISISQSAWAVRMPGNVDEDAIADELEQWLLDQGAVNDDSVTPKLIDPTAKNTYNDSDSDTIPDIVETYLTLTDPTVDDSAITCEGVPADATTGAPAVNFSSQRALRMFNLGIVEAQDLKRQYLTAISICHKFDSISAYNPQFGYSDSDPDVSSFKLVSAGNYVLTLTWSLVNNTTIVLTSDITQNQIDTNAKIQGMVSVNVNGNITEFPFGSSRQADDILVGQINGVVGLQTKVMDGSGPLATVDSNIRNPGSRVGFIVVNPEGPQVAPDKINSVVWYTETGKPLPGYFVPATGGLFIASAQKSGNVTETTVIRAIFTRDKSGKIGSDNGSQFRGEFYTSSQTNGQVTKEQFENFYARNGRNVVINNVLSKEGGPEVIAHTIQRPNRRFTRLHYMNVRLRADQIQMTGPAGFSQTLIDMNTTGLGYGDKLRIRNNTPGFVDNPAIGVAGIENDRGPMRISQLIYQSASGDATQILPNGTYSATSTVIGDSNADRTHNGTYTAVNDAYSVVSNLQFNGISWDKNNDITNVGVNRAHTISFAHADQGNTNRYQIILTRKDGMPVNAVGANRLFIRNGAPPATLDAVMTLDAGLLEAGANYCLRVQARYSINRSLRSETALHCFTTENNPFSSSPGIGGGPAGQVTDISGSWAFKETVTNANGVCAGEVGTTTPYTAQISQNNNDITAMIGSNVVNGTITGNNIQISGNLPEDGGITTFTMSATISGRCVTGTSNWTWTDGVDTCNGGVSSIEATPTNDTNACAANKPAAPSGGGGGAFGIWLLLLTFLTTIATRRTM